MLNAYYKELLIHNLNYSFRNHEANVGTAKCGVA